MLKVLIADDEEAIRDGLKVAVDWENYGYQICMEARNGIDAYKMACELHPDLIIADIRMPGLDGLQLLERLKAAGEGCKALILSGYSEFQYAKTSIGLGVESYLLKPLDEDELTECIVKISRDIAAERRWQVLVDGSLRDSKNSLIADLVTGHRAEEMLHDANHLFGLGLPWKSYQVVLADSFTGNFANRVSKNGCRDIIDRFVSNNRYGYVFGIDGAMGILLKDICLDENIKPLEHLKKQLQGQLDVDIAFAIGPATDDVKKIQTSYECASRLMQNKFVWGSQRIACHRSSASAHVVIASATGSIEKITGDLYMAIELNHKDQICDLLEQLVRCLTAQHQEEGALKAAFGNVLFDLLGKLTVRNGMQVQSGILNKMFCGADIEEWRENVKVQLISYSDALAQGTPDTALKRIIHYINKNYDQQLKIENLAHMFGYNSVYLGQLFKNYTGEYFNTYLELIRIEKAKQLIGKGLKLYQVAEQVGYHDMDYFRAKFKKHEGITPSEYKDGLYPRPDSVAGEISL